MPVGPRKDDFMNTVVGGPADAPALVMIPGMSFSLGTVSQGTRQQLHRALQELASTCAAEIVGTVPRRHLTMKHCPSRLRRLWRRDRFLFPQPGCAHRQIPRACSGFARDWQFR